MCHLVYLCAFALAEAETCQAAAVDEARATGISYAGRPDVAAALVLAADGTTTLTPEGAVVALYQDCDDATRVWALDRLGPHPMVTLRQSPASVAWRSVPSTYVVCTEDMIVHADLQRILARRCADTVELATGHSPFLARPDLVVDLLASVVHRLG